MSWRARLSLCAALFMLGLAGAVLATSGCSDSNDENKALVATQTVNGTVRVITTGP
jgi:hypothetical protein